MLLPLFLLLEILAAAMRAWISWICFLSAKLWQKKGQEGRAEVRLGSGARRQLR